MDNISPLRQLTASLATTDAVLFAPPVTYRVRNNVNTDTPIPQEEPAGENPPDGAIIDFYLGKEAAGEVTLDISDARGTLVRRFSSLDTLYSIPDVNIPLYWIRPQQLLPATAGAHRFIWDLHYQPLNVPAAFPIAATYGNTAPESTSPWMLPANYQVKLSVNGSVYTRQLTVKMDPRVAALSKTLQQEHDVSMSCYNIRREILQATKEINNIRQQIQHILPAVKGDAAQILNSFDRHLAMLMATPADSAFTGFSKLQADITTVYNIIQDTEMPPTTQVLASAVAAQRAYAKTWAVWTAIKNKELPALNSWLQAAGSVLIK